MGNPDMPDSKSQHRKLIRLVRPYVLEKGEYPTWLQAEATADDEEANGAPPPSVPNGSGVPGSDETASSSGRKAMGDSPRVDGEPAGHRRPGGFARRTQRGKAVTRKWLSLAALRRGRATIGTIAVAASLAICTLVVLQYYRPGAHQVSQGTPPLTATPETTAHPRVHSSARRFTPILARTKPVESIAPATTTMPPRGNAAHSAAPAPAPAPSPSPTVQGSTVSTVSTVSVSYTVVQQWSDGWQGKYTIVNNGATAIDGWQLSTVLPGDVIDTTWAANFRTSGDILTMYPPSDQMTIAPGGSVVENFVAKGITTTPAGCVFNGAQC
jgi:hypothetical protein